MRAGPATRPREEKAPADINLIRKSAAQVEYSYGLGLNASLIVLKQGRVDPSSLKQRQA
jgi:hypothetical protein